MNWRDWLKSKFEAVPEGRINPEAGCVVTISDTQVSCARPSGLVETVGWDDLKEVAIVTTDEGPFATDVMWLLVGEESGCVVPQGATGEDELLGRLQSLPGFNNEAVIEAMGSTSNRKFVCWEKVAADS
jgi:hypothetical protein